MNPLAEPRIEDIAASLRAIRKQKGLTLKEVEIKSAGRWKAVVIGSYERCDRALSLKKAINLAAFYEMPLDELLGLGNRDGSVYIRRVTLDLRKVRENTPKEGAFTALANFTALICAKRRDWNGEVLSLRDSDLTVLALLLTLDEQSTLEWLNLNQLILVRKLPI